jgi:hypothetical protein
MPLRESGSQRTLSLSRFLPFDRVRSHVRNAATEVVALMLTAEYFPCQNVMRTHRYCRSFVGPYWNYIDKAPA